MLPATRGHLASSTFNRPRPSARPGGAPIPLGPETLQMCSHRVCLFSLTHINLRNSEGLAVLPPGLRCRCNHPCSKYFELQHQWIPQAIAKIPQEKSCASRDHKQMVCEPPDALRPSNKPRNATENSRSPEKNSRVTMKDSLRSGPWNGQMAQAPSSSPCRRPTPGRAEPL